MKPHTLQVPAQRPRHHENADILRRSGDAAQINEAGMNRILIAPIRVVCAASSLATGFKPQGMRHYLIDVALLLYPMK
jgi:hypothetical protein